MANTPKPVQPTTPTGTDEISSLALLQSAGFGNMVGLGTEWIAALNDLSVEVATFVADRITEDMKTQHKILHCKDLTELQSIQAQFIQKAMDQYQAETGKLVDMGTRVFSPLGDGR